MKTERVTYFLLALCGLFILAWAAIILLLVWPIEELSLQSAGTFGDSFGVLTAFFSGLAFAGLIGTLLLQRDELRLQREELQLTRVELRRSSLAQGEQVEALRETAMLNALATLTAAYTDISLTKVGGQPSEAQEAKPKRDELLKRLESLLESMGSERRAHHDS